MTTPPQIPKSHRRPPKWPWLVCIAFLLSPIIGGLIWFINYRVTNANAVRKLEARAQQRGEPITLVELQQKFPPVAEDENAATVLLASWEKREPEFWEAFETGERPLPTRAPRNIPPDVPFIGKNSKAVTRSKPLPDASRAAAESYLAENRDEMNAMREALKRPRARFPVKVTDGYDALLPHLAKIKSEVVGFQIEALLAAERADADSAIASLRDVGRIGNLLNDDPFLIAQLVRIACFSMSLNGSEHLLSRQKLTRPQLNAMRGMLDELKLTNAFKMALITERATALSVFDLPAATADHLFSDGSGEDEAESATGFREGMSFLSAVGVAAADRRMMLETFERGLSLAEQDTPQALAEFRQLIADTGTRSRKFPPKIFCSLLLPALERAADRFASLEARRRAAMTAIAIEEYRLAHEDALPPTLESLVPQFLAAPLADPFDGKPLRFKKLPKGFMVYSIGPDRIDDGGAERAIKSKQKNFDETFVVER